MFFATILLSLTIGCGKTTTPNEEDVDTIEVDGADLGSPDKPRGLSIQPCKSEKEEPYIRHSSQGRSECLYLRIE